MNTLIGFEIKKILQRKISIISISLTLALIVISGIGIMFSEKWATSYDEATDTVKFDKGPSALAAQQDEIHAQSGYLTNERIKQIVAANNVLMSNPDNVITSLSENDDTTFEVKYLKDKFYPEHQKTAKLEQFISRAYSPYGQYDRSTIDRLNPEKMGDMYQKRTQSINDYLNRNFSYGNYTDAEKQVFNEMNAKLDTPFYYDHVARWENMANSTSSYTILAIFLALICLAPLFSGEYQSGADSILMTTKHGRGKIAAIKIKAGFLFATALYFTVHLVNFIVISLCFGTLGANCPIQISQFFSPYNLTYLQQYFLSLAIGYVALLSVIALVFAISAWLKTPFTTIIIAAALFVAPNFLPPSEDSRLINYLMYLFPIKAVDTNEILNSYMLYNVFGTYVQPLPVIMIVLAIVAAILVPLCIHGYKKHQVS